MKKREKVYKLDTFLTHLGAALGVDFRRIWGRFGELFGTTKAPKYGKMGGPKTIDKQDLKKMSKKSCGPKTVMRAGAMCSPRRTFQQIANRQDQSYKIQDQRSALETLHFVP